MIDTMIFALTCSLLAAGLTYWVMRGEVKRLEKHNASIRNAYAYTVDQLVKAKQSAAILQRVEYLTGEVEKAHREWGQA